MFSILSEYAPKNPNTIVIKNEFYPKGLSELDVYNYYMNNKKKILNEVSGRDLMLFLAVDTNKFIVRRHTKFDDFIQLDYYNYDRIINGRVVSIHSTFGSRESFGIVDIDCSNFDDAKYGAAEVYDLLVKYNPKLEIRYTGKDSFHILYKFDHLYEISRIRSMLKELLSDLAANQKYTINKTRSKDKINLDLSSNKIRGGFITLHSLSILGLRCMKISRNNLLSFNKTFAKIQEGLS